jgi:hypothetical protein
MTCNPIELNNGKRYIYKDRIYTNSWNIYSYIEEGGSDPEETVTVYQSSVYLPNQFKDYVEINEKIKGHPNIRKLIEYQINHSDLTVSGDIISPFNSISINQLNQLKKEILNKWYNSIIIISV